jgi:hypothetical protein
MAAAKKVTETVEKSTEKVTETVKTVAADSTKLVTDSVKGIENFVKNSCDSFVDSWKEARETGSDKAKEITANVKINDTVDANIAKVSGFMGELVGTGYALTLCPANVMKEAGKSLNIIK